MMAKRPEERPASMTEVISILESCKADDAETRSPAGDVQKSRPALMVFNETPVKRTGSPTRKADPSIFATARETDGLRIGDELNLEDLVMDVRPDVRPEPLPLKRLPPKPRREHHPRKASRRSSALSVLGGIALLGLGSAAYMLIPGNAPKPPAGQHRGQTDPPTDPDGLTTGGVQRGNDARNEMATADVMNAIQGVWQSVAGEEIGRVLDDGEAQRQHRRVTIKGNSFVMERTYAGAFGTYNGTFTLDASDSHFDWTGTRPGGAPITLVGIYELNGDTLRLCYRYQERGRARRPTAFQSDADRPNISVSFVFKRPLFDNNDLTAWEGRNEYWRQSNGTLIGSPPPRLPAHTFYCSRRVYRDFELRFSARLKGGIGNSGVQFRSAISDRNNFLVIGPQCELGRVSAAYPPGSLVTEPSGKPAISALIGNLAEIYKEDQFNDFSIRCVGKHVTIRLNGVMAVDAEIPSIPDEGIIAWQLHGRESPEEVTFQNVTLVELNRLADGGSQPSTANGENNGLDDRPTLVAPHRVTSLVADGVIGPGEYGPGIDVDFTARSRFGALLAGMGNSAMSKSPQDLSIRLAAAYSDRALFLAVHVRDQSVHTQAAGTDSPYLGDCVEIFLDGDRVANDFTPEMPWNQRGSREGFQLLADAAGHRMTVASALTNDNWNAATKRTGDGYIVECEIPLSSIDVEDGPRFAPPKPGALINLGMAIDDSDENVEGKRSFGYVRARTEVASPFMGGENSWSFGIRLAPAGRN